LTPTSSFGIPSLEMKLYLSSPGYLDSPADFIVRYCNGYSIRMLLGSARSRLTGKYFDEFEP
jgi:hypothetical protein